MTEKERVEHDRRFISAETCKFLEGRYGIKSGDSMSTLMRKMITFHGGNWTEAEGVWIENNMSYNLAWQGPNGRLLGWR